MDTPRATVVGEAATVEVDPHKEADLSEPVPAGLFYVEIEA